MNSELQTYLEVRGVCKNFGDLLANDNVCFKIGNGEIHAILGENGAGKSTLVKIIYGVLAPDRGEILWKGTPIRITSPAFARSLGIGMVFQHFSLFESLTVVENIALAIPEYTKIDKLSNQILDLSSEYGLKVDPQAIVAELSVGERQRIEIVRCLLQNPSLIIMDEPTSVLTPQEAEQLSAVLKRLASEGCAVLYISHRLEEVQKLCHSATVLRQGKVVGTCNPREVTASHLANLMVGENVSGIESSEAPEYLDERKLELNGLSLPKSSDFSISLKNVNLKVHAGEVVAIAGVAGNGQSELFDAISGERTVSNNNSVRINGVACGKKGISGRRKLNAAFVPEERLGHAAVSSMRLAENVILTRHAVDKSMVSMNIVSNSRAKQIENAIVEQHDVRMSHANSEAGSLSGGNLQKFVVGREMNRLPGVLVVNQPTWGVDVGAATNIRTELIAMARSGSAVLVLSQDLDEILEIADRIAVISKGRISETKPKLQLDREKIGLLMGGKGDFATTIGDSDTPASDSVEALI